VAEDGVHASVGGNPVFGSPGCRCFLEQVADGDDPYIGEAGEVVQVLLADDAGTDDADSHGT
jgi:hypothetical protein